MVRITAASVLAVAATYLQSVSAIKEIDLFSCFGDTQVGINKYFSLGTRAPTDSRVIFRCWADAGETNIDVGNVVTYNSGNNAGFLEYEPGDGWLYRHNFGKNVWNNTRNGKGWGAVVKIHIN
ncbi:hypothetical protein ACRE_060750 [Hapsidospora chrysogenum ATCC 11550]|uniref:Streptomyces killer toxin-like beta/gamma crystallin domain-containing protein n=1 Tax=Hapsidospora chrysogenum (strain ATCC 11550 / CBS 779.69 / DSM 880 / IAM 14645 / JCM 23072 / IMI 49137) TaxID=857340 RepID=A0A086T1F6_HAPC1|nr:hypothetical protein ACRE_060750 [Hapsidospora chrysogenum ATCC 11550]